MIIGTMLEIPDVHHLKQPFFSDGSSSIWHGKLLFFPYLNEGHGFLNHALALDPAVCMLKQTECSSLCARFCATRLCTSSPSGNVINFDLAQAFDLRKSLKHKWDACPGSNPVTG